MYGRRGHAPQLDTNCARSPQFPDPRIHRQRPQFCSSSWNWKFETSVSALKHLWSMTEALEIMQPSYSYLRCKNALHQQTSYASFLKNSPSNFDSNWHLQELMDELIFIHRKKFFVLWDVRLRREFQIKSLLEIFRGFCLDSSAT